MFAGDITTLDKCCVLIVRRRDNLVKLKCDVAWLEYIIEFDSFKYFLKNIFLIFEGKKCVFLKKNNNEGLGTGGVGEKKGGGAQNFALSFSPSRLPCSLFFSLSGCLLVEFWWCLKRRDPQMRTFGLSGCRVKPQETPRPPLSRRPTGGGEAKGK